MTRIGLGFGFAALVLTLAACGGADESSVCGDGEKQGSEQCDDGNRAPYDGCSASCQLETDGCGDGTVNASKETCDDGNAVGGDGCSATCQLECGNGMLDEGEECDDDNRMPNDGCNSQCKAEAGYTCSGEPSDCTLPTGACADPYFLILAANGNALSGMGTGDTSTSSNQVAEAACDGFTSGGGKDQIWQLTLTEPRDVAIELTDATAFDASLRLLHVACDQTSEVVEHVGEDGCSDSGFNTEVLNYTALPAGTYFIVVDAYDDTEQGMYEISVTAIATQCGNGALDGAEVCDDGNTATNDGCNASCDVELGYACTGAPSVCTSACGNGGFDNGEECDDDNTVDGDRCSATCTLEFDTAEAEPNDVAAQVITAGNHLIKGSLPSGTDVDLYTFTLTAPATVEIETYDAMDPTTDYDGAGTLDTLDCLEDDTELRIFDANGDLAMDDTALAYDDEDGAYSCSYLGPHDEDGNTMEGVLQPGTYTIKVTPYGGGTATRYILDIRISSDTPSGPAPGDLAINEVMSGDNMSDTNCDGAVTGTLDEFIEIVNVSSKVLDLTGVTIHDALYLRHAFAAAATGSLMLAPGKSVVVWAGGAPACAGVTNWFTASSGQLGLNDAGDTVTLKDAQMATLATTTLPAATLNVSFNRSPDVVGTSYVNHNTLNGAVGAFSPGTKADGTAF
jgi:cysteine-rich repeat protein